MPLGYFDTAQAERDYAQAFRDYGIDVLTLGPREAAEKLAARSIRAELCIALADWALVCRARHNKDDSTWKDLLAVARAADQDALLRLWDALERADPHALKELAGEERVLELPPLALCLLGSALVEMGAGDQAITLLERAQREHPDDFWINHELASSLLHRKPPRWKEAIPFFTAAVALRPRSPGAYLNLGRALSKAGAEEAAAAAFDKAILLKPDYAEAHCNRGIVLRYHKKLTEAEAEFRKALDLNPDLPQAHCNLGVALAEQGKSNEAEKAYRKAIALGSDSPEPFLNLGNLLCPQGRLTEAEAAYREALKRDPDLVPVYGELGAVLYHLGRLKEAEEVSREGIRLKTDYAKAYGHLGLALRGQGKLAEAEAAYRKAISLKSDDGEPWVNLGILLIQQRKLNEAEEAFRQAIKRQPGFALAFLNLGNLLVQQRKPHEAEEAFRQAIKRQPDFALAFSDLAGVLGQQGKWKEAEEAARAAVGLDGTAVYAHANLGLVLQAQGNFAGALAEFQRGLELRTGKPGDRAQLTKMLQRAQHLVDLDVRLSEFARGTAPPAGAAERLDLARFCLMDKHFYAASAGWYGQAFAAQPALADNLSTGNRYNAACAAALAGCGKGKDASGLDDNERARLRKQALDWLRADLTAWRNVLEKDKTAPVVGQHMQHWLDDADFNGVRGAEALAKLPEAERGDWQRLWEEVAALRQQAQPKEK